MAELNPHDAAAKAREMAHYVESFNGQKWGGVDESPDRQNLAMALDHLQETAAMLANLAEPFETAASPAPAAPRGTDAQILKERELTALAIQGAIAYGQLGKQEPPDDSAWLRPFYEIGRQLAATPPQQATPAAGALSGAFEDWLHRECPSGDATEVQRQWEASSDYANFWNDATPAASPIVAAQPELTDAEIRAGWEHTFSTNNPFCPCDLKSFTKAVRWAERKLGKARAALATRGA